MAHRRNLDDAALAAACGISRAQLNRIRNERAVPRVSTALRLARVLGCRVADVFWLSPCRRE